MGPHTPGSCARKYFATTYGDGSIPARWRVNVSHSAASPARSRSGAAWALAREELIADLPRSVGHEVLDLVGTHFRVVHAQLVQLAYVAGLKQERAHHVLAARPSRAEASR